MPSSHAVPGAPFEEGQYAMSEQMQSEIADLSNQMEAIEDPRRCYALVKERIMGYRQKGVAVPRELALLEKQLMTECLAESQGR